MIYVDNTILSTFRTCHEKARLSFVQHLQPIQERAPLSFGSAIHEAIATYRCHPATERLDRAKHRFISYLKEQDSKLPIAIESEERRSVERGLALIEAYDTRWKDEPYIEFTRPDTGQPYVEIGFAIEVMVWRGTPVVYVGKLDAIRRNRIDGRLYNWELKTTTTGLSNYITHVRPNHQITGYHKAVEEILHEQIAGTVWDCIFVSDRKPDEKAPNHFRKLGIDIEKDFARQETRRSPHDLEEFMYDTKLAISDYLNYYYDSQLPRWDRNTAACHFFGGCHFRKICESNGNESIIRSLFTKREWKPWEGIV